MTSLGEVAVPEMRPTGLRIQTKESLEHDLKVSNLFFAIAESQKRTVNALIKLRMLQTGVG